MPATTLPPFPDNIPTHPLLVIDYELIKAGDKNEIDRLWKAATELGFWYLKNHGADEEVSGMFDMGDETVRLPLEEKLKFEQGNTGQSFGYKAPGSLAIDLKGSKDELEFLNISKDDALAWPRVVHRTYPSTVNARMENTIKPFVRKSVEINNTFLSIMENRLGLPKGVLLDRHDWEKPSGSEARCIHKPAKKRDAVSDEANANATTKVASEPAEPEDPTVALGAHTDFGSLSFLHNRLGGLQVLPPGSTSWQYVRPLPGHAICNVGDALSIFSGGILRSNLHRVVPPPGQQAYYPRWSLVFFLRPSNEIELKALSDESVIVKAAMDKFTEEERQRYYPKSTASEWFARRVKYSRAVNRTDPEGWKQARGMEPTNVV